MSILLVSQSDLNGGAARAAYRLHRALFAHGAKSLMRVRSKRSDDCTVVGPVTKLDRASILFRPFLGSLPLRLQKTANAGFHSGNWLPSHWADGFAALDAEVINLHWVAGETLSIEDIGRIRKPVVWTLHDMWPFCGTEHYAADDALARWRLGYDKANQPVANHGLDVDRMVWQRKRRAWKRPMHIVAPSRWLADCARESALFHHWPISVIPNVLDTEIYQPLDRNFCRKALGLPANRKIILFGAIDGARDLRKGYDLLLDVLARLASRVDVQDILCLVFGQGAPLSPPVLSFPTRWMGHLHDDTTLTLLYNSADVMVVPSRQEAFGQTASEALACGSPVVTFDHTGLRDVVTHRETGYLARADDVDDMAEGLRWILEDASRRHLLGRAARERALRLWAPDVVVAQYLRVYEDAMSMQGTDR